jgi:hypothetical protein
LRQRVDALNLWAKHVDAVIEGHENNVIPLKQA